METINAKIFASFVLMVFTFQVLAQSKIDISKYNCFTSTVKYSNEGNETEGLILFVNHSNKDEPGLKLSNVYLLSQKDPNIQLVGDSSAFISVYDVKISADSKYLALYMVGEGHPWVEIYDLQSLINYKKQDLIADINPYPGNVNLVGWQNNKLIIESDINLILKNDGKDLLEGDFFKKSKKFLFDLTTKKYLDYNKK